MLIGPLRMRWLIHQSVTFFSGDVFWKRYQNMMSDQLKHFVVMIKLSSNYFLLVFHDIAEEKA